MSETNSSASSTTSISSGARLGIAVAIVAIGLLVYKTMPSTETAQITEPSTSGISQSVAKGGTAVGAQAAEGTTTGMASGTAAYDGRSSGGMAQKPGSFNEPKPYQPNVPYTDYRRTVTASDTGIGASTGTTGTLVTK